MQIEPSETEEMSAQTAGSDSPDQRADSNEETIRKSVDEPEGNNDQDATVVASPDSDRTVVTERFTGDATVVGATGELVSAPIESFKPVVEMSLSAHFPYALARQTTTNHLLIEAASYFEGRESARAPVALALVLDKSGSMEGSPMEQLKIAVKYLIDKLSPADLLTIVTFGETSEVVMPLRRVINPDLIRQHVDAIRARGTTNLWGGITDAASEILSAQAPNHLKRILLLTDGEANEGITDFQSIVTEARARHLSGVSFSTLGMGIEYNEELMMAIAKNTGGNYHFVEHPDEIPAVFERELGSLFGVVGGDARLVIELKRDVRVSRVYGLEFEERRRRVTVSLPALEAGRTQSALIELRMEPHPPARFKKLSVELSYLPFGQTERVSQTVSVIFEFTADKEKVRSHENEDVRRALATRDIVAELARAADIAGTDASTATMIVSRAEIELMRAGRSEDATMIAGVAEKLSSGEFDAATKMLSGARFKLDQDRTEIRDVPL